MAAAPDFAAQCALLRAQTERRRLHYRRLFFINAALAALLLGAALLFPRPAVEQLAALLRRAEPVSDAEVASFLFFACIAAGTLLLLPLLRYRGGLHRSVSLQRLVYTRLFEWLGAQSFMSGEVLPMTPPHAPLLFAPGSVLLGETVIRMDSNDVACVLHEVAAFTPAQEGYGCSFRGLLISADARSRQAAALPPAGPTLMHEDAAALAQQHGLKGASLVTPAGHTAFTGDAAAARRLLTPGWEGTLATLAAKAGALAPRRPRWDARLLNAISQRYLTARDYLLSLRQGEALAAEEAFDSAFGLAPAEKWRAALQGGTEPAALWTGLTCLLLLPCPYDLFEPRSLFEESLPQEETDFLLALAEWLPAHTQHLRSALYS